MRIADLATELRRAYDKASPREKVVAIHLFGIKFADEIGGQANAIVNESGISPTYATEVRKGMRLAAYVTLK